MAQPEQFPPNRFFLVASPGGVYVGRRILVKQHRKKLSRRELLVRGSWLTLGVAVAGFPCDLLGVEVAVLDVAYAGSMGSLMEGPIKSTVAQKLNLEMHGRAQGSSALAQLIVGGSIRPDVFIPITPGPMLTVLRAGKAETAQPIAHTEMVVAYNPKSRFAPKFEAAANGKGNWWEVLQEPGLRFGRTDPVTDPQGRNIIFTMMLAAKVYKQPDWWRRSSDQRLTRNRYLPNRPSKPGCKAVSSTPHRPIRSSPGRSIYLT